ncbi:hypothetical protein [Thermus filiformis]|uniref:Uncharacterized protein n=1 Tax=Thermus filiformis TaxID=276 RepID=A0A0A2WS93_THEFI|nr:hypothetical protein [Thermus filiformis]KGQ21622.1 hypothetical protein THFILI_09105 [Thermus filiformis]
MKGEALSPEVLSDLVDLYEYKVEALAQGQAPKGGRVSLLRLRQTLLSARLSPQLAKRFRQADQLYRSLKPAAPPPAEAPILLPELEAEPPRENPDRVLRALGLEVWRIWVGKELKERAKGFLEGGREALRLLYAFLQNFQEYQKTPGFSRDFALNRFNPSLPIPSLSDPIAELDNREVAAGLLEEFLETALGLTDHLPLPPEETRTYFRRAFRKLLENEALYPVGPRPDLKALQRALEEGRRLGLSAKELEALEARLKQAAQEERRISLLLEEDKRRFLVAAERLLGLLALLPAPKGEVPWPEVPAPGEARPGLLTLPLAPGRVRLDGLDLTLSRVGEVWYLGLMGEDYTLEERMVLPMGDLEVWAVHREGLLHLRLEARESARLYELLGEGRVLAYLLYPGKDFAHLRLLRALSARLKGEALEGFGPELAQKYRQAPPDALQDFARKGLQVVAARLKGQDPLPLLEEVGRALGLEQEARTLGSVLGEHLRRKTPTRETLGREVGTLSLSTEPQALKVGPQVLSLRPAEEGVYVGAAGEVPRRLKDLLVYPLAQGQLVLAREGGRVAYLLVVP